MPNPEIMYLQEVPSEVLDQIGHEPHADTVFIRAAGGRRIPALHIEIHGEEYAIVCPTPIVKRHETKWGVKTNLTNHHIEYYESEAQARTIAAAGGVVGLYPPLYGTTEA